MKQLEVQNFTKRYKSFTLDNVSFDIEKGSICGFIGRNGAGKTTTLKGIMKLIHLDEGKVKVFGRDMDDAEYDNRQDIAFSLSEINYFPDARIGTLTDVTKRFYKNWNDELYEKLCKRFNLEQNKKIKELSSGMKVKYSLAVALSHDAKLLILDEPTSGLDPVSRDDILDIFLSLVKKGERSILFSTHITSDLEKCADHIVYIRNGKIVASKTKNDFQNHYMQVDGPINDIEKIKDHVISYKNEGNDFKGLIYTNDVDKMPKSIKITKPDLDTIMVFEERKENKQDEEFDL